MPNTWIRTVKGQNWVQFSAQHCCPLLCEIRVYDTTEDGELQVKHTAPEGHCRQIRYLRFWGFSRRFCLAYERSGTSLHIEKLFRFRIGFSGEKKPANDYCSMTWHATVLR
jgi:hypothetical protein